MEGGREAAWWLPGVANLLTSQQDVVICKVCAEELSK